MALRRACRARGDRRRQGRAQPRPRAGGGYDLLLGGRARRAWPRATPGDHLDGRAGGSRSGRRAGDRRRGAARQLQWRRAGFGRVDDPEGAVDRPQRARRLRTRHDDLRIPGLHQPAPDRAPVRQPQQRVDPLALLQAAGRAGAVAGRETRRAGASGEVAVRRPGAGRGDRAADPRKPPSIWDCRPTFSSPRAAPTRLSA